MKTLQIKYFARIREAIGQEQERLEIEAKTVQDVLDVLIQRGQPWQQALSSTQLLVAVNQEMTGQDAVVSDGDEVAFFPPVTGG